MCGPNPDISIEKMSDVHGYQVINSTNQNTNLIYFTNFYTLPSVTCVTGRFVSRSEGSSLGYGRNMSLIRVPGVRTLRTLDPLISTSLVEIFRLELTPSHRRIRCRTSHIVSGVHV